MKQGLLVMYLLHCAVGSAAGRQWFVAPGGDDGSGGTRDRPLATIQRAADAMRPGDTCVIRGGAYAETITPRASGEKGKPITFRAAAGEKVLLTGAAPLTGWAKHAGAIWKAPMPWNLGKNNQLFFDGKPLTEARWPNKASDRLMDSEGAKIDSADDAGLICARLPDGNWTGAVVWALAGAKWTSWSSTVTGYDAARKKLLLEIPKPAQRFMHPGKGGEFYVSGKLGLLDAPGEWCYDVEAKTICMRPPDDADPNDHTVEAKKRMLAFDVRGKSYVHVIGIDVCAATVDLRDAHHCLVRGMRAEHVSHTRGGNTSYGLGEPTGITVAGSGNVIRDSEVAYSAGDGILLGGEHNAVVNCHVHDIDYFGCYGTPVKLTGTANMLSHCTIHDTGRDCIQVRGQAHLIQHNHVYNCGLIAQDLGFLYTCANDGGGTEICYNWFHDNLSKHTRCGIYLDNFTSNYLVHHNIVWNTNGDEIRLNKPSQYNLVYNNTILGNLGNWGRWKTDRMYGDRVQNNLIGGRIAPHPDLLLSHNLTEVPAHEVDDCGLDQVRNDLSGPAAAARETAGGARVGVDAGSVVPGVTDGFDGDAPDVGAYESGAAMWTAGHDFANPPHPEYRLTETPFRNRVVNGSFDWPSTTDVIAGWAKTHAKQAKLIRGRSGITENQDERDSFIGRAVCLSGEADDGIEQTVIGLEPNTR